MSGCTTSRLCTRERSGGGNASAGMSYERSQEPALTRRLLFLCLRQIPKTRSPNRRRLGPQATCRPRTTRGRPWPSSCVLPPRDQSVGPNCPGAESLVPQRTPTGQLLPDTPATKRFRLSMLSSCLVTSRVKTRFRVDPRLVRVPASLRPEIVS